jgi:hypothetical protein
MASSLDPSASYAPSAPSAPSDEPGYQSPMQQPKKTNWTAWLGAFVFIVVILILWYIGRQRSQQEIQKSINELNIQSQADQQALLEKQRLEQEQLARTVLAENSRRLLEKQLKDKQEAERQQMLIDQLKEKQRLLAEQDAAKKRQRAIAEKIAQQEEIARRQAALAAQQQAVLAAQKQVALAAQQQAALAAQQQAALAAQQQAAQAAQAAQATQRTPQDTINAAIADSQKESTPSSEVQINTPSVSGEEVHVSTAPPSEITPVSGDVVVLTPVSASTPDKKSDYQLFRRDVSSGTSVAVNQTQQAASIAANQTQKAANVAINQTQQAANVVAKQTEKEAKKAWKKLKNPKKW